MTCLLGAAFRASLNEDIGDEAAAYSLQAEGFNLLSIVWRYENTLSACVAGGLVGADPDLVVDVAQRSSRTGSKTSSVSAG